MAGGGETGGAGVAKPGRGAALAFPDVEIEDVTPNQTRFGGGGLQRRLRSGVTCLPEASEPSSVCGLEAFSKANVRAKPPISSQSTSSPGGRREGFCV